MLYLCLLMVFSRVVAKHCFNCLIARSPIKKAAPRETELPMKDLTEISKTLADMPAEALVAAVSLAALEWLHSLFTPSLS
jgi:hypothetical protein